ncbi:MAG TPA: hypothetical protein VGT78_08485 [Rhizomicrobium sp.]|nr:hypothetical protein [Rhizomicrobium sp.]
MSAYVKPQRILLGSQPELDEKWVQKLIAADPSILGLGDLILRDQERIQPRAGRLDLLLQDTETKRRYEVELQLGETDESHIIRTIEYWDIERKRYPQYDHCAVIIAEDITSRFLNVISLFNGTVPLVAIQMQALKVGEALTLVFTTVLDEMPRGLVDEDEEEDAAPVDRTYWETKASKNTVALADELLRLVQKHETGLSLRYNRAYIGVTRNGQAFNFISFRPKKNHVNFTVKLPKTPEWDQKIEEGGLETLEYARWGAYRLRLSKDDVANRAPLLVELMLAAFKERSS